MKKCPVCKTNIKEIEPGVYKCLCGYREIQANKESTVEIRLYNHKTSQVFYKNLTVNEILQIANILKGIKWE
ncbi:30S ribosomal protein S23 [Clostridium botulinum]|uniref:30S ribosomal protein S23 n=1 Tax=Clostridium botulinum TaxID=1491 RepID=A0A6M0T1K1_CLOBO|nr:30S ribosomal protein S23 [Clostridium botulinum]NFI74383.1 30S ribosomal protein S23 [Clostridium sporogenes]NFP62291.1 30S ribosomal protein S23 [Clostridium sporogenes]NFU95557.1 30S ribosomal protein S23 [Clostridium sporogenes]NFV67890.1 30S ribosomal protein S23 [Clostridium botulinum]